MHPCARQGVAIVRVFRAATRFEPTATAPDTIDMGDAAFSLEPSLATHDANVLSETPRVLLTDRVAGSWVFSFLGSVSSCNKLFTLLYLSTI